MINVTIKNLEDVRVALIFRLLSFEGSVNVVCLTKLARYSLFLNPSRSNVFYWSQWVWFTFCRLKSLVKPHSIIGQNAFIQIHVIQYQWYTEFFLVEHSFSDCFSQKIGWSHRNMLDLPLNHNQVKVKIPFCRGIAPSPIPTGPPRVKDLKGSKSFPLFHAMLRSYNNIFYLLYTIKNNKNKRLVY